MRKGFTIFVVLALLVSLGFALDANDAVKRVQWSRLMKSTFGSSDQAVSKANIQKVLPVERDRMELKRLKLRQTQQSASPRKAIRKNVPFRAEKIFQPGLPVAEVAGMDTLTLYPDGIPDTVSYTAGDELWFYIYTGSDTVRINFYVDDGDSVFMPEYDYLIEDKEMGEIKIWDGVEFDESPAGDGMFMVTINTTAIMEYGPGPYFALQNAIVYAEVLWPLTQETNHGMALVGAPDENTSIEGTVLVDSDTIPAAENVIVWVFQIPADGVPYEDWEPQVGFVTLTDNSGLYRIEIPDLHQGKYMVGVYDAWQLYPGFFPDPPGMELDIMGDISAVDFVLVEASETIYGYVTDDGDAPLEGITVWAENGPQFVETMTDPTGYYELAVMPGWWWVGIDEESIYGQYMLVDGQELEVTEGGDHPADFVLNTLNSTFSGHVTDTEGNPVADVEVYADIWLGEEGGFFWNYTYSDESGYYELGVSDVLQGQTVVDWEDTLLTSYWIGAWIPDGIITPDGYPDQYAPASGLDFTVLESDAMLSGYVYDRDTNQLLFDAGVHAFMPDTTLDGTGAPLDFWYYTHEDGFYEIPLIGGPAPDGNSWIIEVFWPWEWMPSLIDTLAVISGNNYEQDYWISPPVTEGFIEGYVFDEDGNGLPDARVEIYGPEYYELYTDGGGYFSIDGIPFGNYSATAYAEGYEPYDIHDIWVGSESVYLEFWMGSIIGDILISGYITDAGTDEPIPAALLLAFNWNLAKPFHWFTDTTGYYEFKIKPDMYDFQVGANGYWAEFNEGVEVRNDTTINYQLTAIETADTLEGNVVNENDNPLRKVFIYFESDEYIGFTYTDFNGHYTIGLPAGYYDALYQKSGFMDEWRGFQWPDEWPEDPIVLFPEQHVFGPEILEVKDVPDDNGKQVRLTWKRAEGLMGAVKEYQVWRAIPEMPGPDPVPNPEQPIPWDFVQVVPVHPEMNVYNVVVPTLYDKVGEDIYWTGFIVTAIGYDSYNFWNSNIKAGWSEDNNPPEVPTDLSGAGTGSSIVLNWREVTNEKVKYYTVYRKTASTEYVTAGYAAMPEYVDEEVSLSEEYTYSVTATDFGLNESGQSDPVTVAATAIGEEAEVPTEFALKANYPNPFNPETTLEFALPKTSQVILTIYNLTGQRVRELVHSEYPPGYQRVIWDGRDQFGNPVSSGVYIYTLKAGTFSKTRKMILMR